MYTEAAASIIEDTSSFSRGWHVLWTHSNCERTVYEQLLMQGYKVFLPTIGRWSRRGDLRYIVQVPMFTGYLFLHYPVDKSSYIQICKTKGLARILGQCWDRLATVPAPEIEAIQKLIKSDL